MTTLGPDWHEPGRGTPPPPPPPPYNPPPVNYGGGWQEPPKKKNGWVKWVVGGIVAVVVLIVVLCLGLGWLGRESAKEIDKVIPTVTTATTDTPEIYPRATAANEKTFLSQMRTSNQFAESVTDTELLNEGYTMCAALRDGKSLPDIGIETRSRNLTDEQSSYLITGGVAYLCREQASKIPNE